jgi:hypothetical protein
MNPEESGFFVATATDALVVESVDTQDLKSCGHCGRAGSSPARGTKEKALMAPFFISIFFIHL